MCEKRIRKIKRGSESTRLREARRLERRQRPPTITVQETRSPLPCRCVPQFMDKTTKTKVMLHLAMRTAVLLQRNTLIRQKMADLQKETSDYVAAVMSHPENRKRYLEQVRLYGVEVAQANVLRRRPLYGVEQINMGAMALKLSVAKSVTNGMSD